MVRTPRSRYWAISFQEFNVPVDALRVSTIAVRCVPPFVGVASGRSNRGQQNLYVCGRGMRDEIPIRSLADKTNLTQRNSMPGARQASMWLKCGVSEFVNPLTYLTLEFLFSKPEPFKAY